MNLHARIWSIPSRAPNRRAQRGVTMISVMMLTVSLLTLGLLAVRSSTREVKHAGQLVARERATMVAQAAVDLAAAQYMSLSDDELDDALAGGQGVSLNCDDPCADCIPQDLDGPTGRRNPGWGEGDIQGCGGRPCMRPGAVAFIGTATSQTRQTWCEEPFRNVMPNGDPEAQVSVWVRNNMADALGPAGSGSWLDDLDERIVITAMASVRNTTVTIEREVVISTGMAQVTRPPQSADEGYGGGHNNDNTVVSVCTDEYVQVDGV